MNDLAIVHHPTSINHRSAIAAPTAPLPEPRHAKVVVRAADVSGGVGDGDIKFIDRLMKTHAKMVGFMPFKTLEGHIAEGRVLMATDASKHGERLGYVLHTDCYFKREDVGIVYHLNVLPDKHRGLIGAALVKAAFERSARSCKLYCCWCAQDIEANYFWESIGFVPLAFRTGSRGVAQGGRRKEGRIHIFWQKRIREGDDSTPYWFPSKTDGGALKEKRIVLPIPPGTHWSDAKPMVVPGFEGAEQARLESDVVKAERKPRERKSKAAVQARNKRDLASGGLWCAPSAASANASEKAASKPRREKRPAHTYDPRYLAAAREVCDRYLEEVNSGRLLLESSGATKYEVSRQLEASESALKMSPALLTQAAA